MTAPVDAWSDRGTTAENLTIAAEEELHEGVEFYTGSCKSSEKEEGGFKEIASHFSAIAEIEQRHRERFLAYLETYSGRHTLETREKP